MNHSSSEAAMNKLAKIAKVYLLLGLTLLLLAVIGIYGVKNGKPVQPSKQAIANQDAGQKLEKEEGNITVSMEYLAGKSDGNANVFEVTLDTHSVLLDSFDFEKGIILEKDGKSIAPLSVNPSGDGHHRSAEITFTKIELPFTIVVTNLADIIRREFTFSNL